ncbi:MAG: hypothetical protein ACKOW4_00675 [Aquirufa sp.]
MGNQHIHNEKITIHDRLAFSFHPWILPVTYPLTLQRFAYFNQKEKDYAEFRKAQMQEEVKVETLKITKKTMNTYWTIAAIGVALSLIPLLLL